MILQANTKLIIARINADEHEYKLIRDLLEDYNTYARPSLHYKSATNVTFGLSLSQLIDVV